MLDKAHSLGLPYKTCQDDTEEIYLPASLNLLVQLGAPRVVELHPLINIRLGWLQHSVIKSLAGRSLSHKL